MSDVPERARARGLTEILRLVPSDDSSQDSFRFTAPTRTVTPHSAPMRDSDNASSATTA